MDRRQYVSMAIMAGVGILAALIAWIATRPSGEAAPPPSAVDAVRIAAEILQARIDGKEAPDRRRALRAALVGVPDAPLTRALRAFADGDTAALTREKSESPFARGLRGWTLGELGRRAEAVEELRQALSEAPASWEFRGLFEAALRKAEERHSFFSPCTVC